MTHTIEVGILGATGVVGQQFAARLAGHPWFRVTWLAASERSEGRRYGELPWRLPVPCPGELREHVVDVAAPGRGPRLVFSALDAAAAQDLEPAFAAAGHLVVSNARSYRMDDAVPLLVPEINPDHLGLLPLQRERGWKGAIVTNPNCSTVFLSMALAALRPLNPRLVMVTTLQAASGAGYPGVASLDLLGNVIPFIEGEEEKIETEPLKILGCFRNGRVEPYPVRISAHTTRVPVADGHTEMLSIGFEETPQPADLLDAFERFRGKPQEAGLPSAPSRPIAYLAEPDRPQPRLDVDRDGGMTVSVGRLRKCALLDYKLAVLGHNTVRGAAGAAVLNAELMHAEGLV
jgi:aspartate-semialdehyde dehydrogenase